MVISTIWQNKKQRFNIQQLLRLKKMGLAITEVTEEKRGGPFGAEEKAQGLPFFLIAGGVPVGHV